MNALQDDRGNYSSIRIVLMFAIIVFVFLLYLFTKTLFIEIQKDVINYQGLALLFTAMITEVAVVLILKVFQKKYENKKDTKP